ncbi:MAG: hypothetical protein JKY37_33690 [Nannocystaceae bacterium]|nr:hypothetical protein [Nannocystaceae bacterium]
MSTTISMWLGILFVGLGLAAVLLQAWLWNPKCWDEVAKKTNAPRVWLMVHRWVGILFTVIYVVLMWEMIPRLWEYQVELPARTVMHAVASIVLGILLFTKLLILRFFRHFEESMPALGFGILICTIVLGTLSIPFALRAQGIGVEAFSDSNVDRVRKLMTRIEMPDDTPSVETLTSEDGMSRGRQVLVGPCVRCHDMRTVLAKPRSAKSWYKVVDRMLEKPSVFGEPLDPADVPYVTAYLVAITPEIHESRQLAAEDARNRGKLISGVLARLTGGEPEDPTAGDPTPPVATDDGAVPTADGSDAAPKPKAEPPVVKVDTSEGPALLEQYCTDCHELDEVYDYGGGDLAKWTSVMKDMIVEEEAEVPEDAATVITHFLAQKYPAGS